MRFESYLAYRIINKDRDNFSRPIIRISITAIALGVSIMLVSIAIVTGFQQTVSQKITGFTSHIRVVNFHNNKSWEISPVEKNQDFYPHLQDDENIEHIQIFGLKAGVMKHEGQIMGSVLKGISDDYNWEFMEKNLIKGERIHLYDSSRSNDIIISRYHANKLKLDTGQSVLMHFIQDPPRYRKFNVAGIYSSGIEEMDKRFVLCDLRHIQRLNDWSENEVAGFEIFLKDMNDLDEYTNKIYETTGFDLKVENIRSLHPQIMDWLDMLNTNVIIIIILMVLVSAITMVSTLLILILEKTNMIGILKALGSKNKSIRKVFIYNALYIVGKGLLWGNIIGLGLLFIQKSTGLITLDETTYYMAYVPVNFNLAHILLVNAGTVMICFLFMILPSYLVSRINPVDAIQFD
ncbi:MAG: FtsX-like permease family protein [Bacteroidales bacterium]